MQIAIPKEAAAYELQTYEADLRRKAAQTAPKMNAQKSTAAPQVNPHVSTTAPQITQEQPHVSTAAARMMQEQQTAPQMNPHVSTAAARMMQEQPTALLTGAIVPPMGALPPPPMGAIVPPRAIFTLLPPVID